MAYDWDNFDEDCKSYEEKLTASHRETAEFRKVVEEYSNFLESFGANIPLRKELELIIAQIHVNRLFSMVIVREYADKIEKSLT